MTVRPSDLDFSRSEEADLITELTTMDEFKKALKGRGPIVITDSTHNTFHANPWSCGDGLHVTMENFHQKVVVNNNSGGRYFSVSTFPEAEQRWSSITRCH